MQGGGVYTKNQIDKLGNALIYLCQKFEAAGEPVSKTNLLKLVGQGTNNFTHRTESIWYKTALKNGVLDLLEKGQMTTTDIEIPLFEIIEGEEEKLRLGGSSANYSARSAFTGFDSAALIA